MKEPGLKAIEVQKFLGHHSILTTARYTRLTDQTKHHARERINGPMDGFSIDWGTRQMICLATVIDTCEADFLTQYRNRLRPEHDQARAAMMPCRTQVRRKLNWWTRWRL